MLESELDFRKNRIVKLQRQGKFGTPMVRRAESNAHTYNISSCDSKTTSISPSAPAQSTPSGTSAAIPTSTAAASTGQLPFISTPCWSSTTNTTLWSADKIDVVAHNQMGVAYGGGLFTLHCNTVCAYFPTKSLLFV